MIASADKGCPGCESMSPCALLEIDQCPVLCNILCATREEALDVPRGRIRLTYCDQCGLIYNSAFDRRLLRYTGAYENSLQFSKRFQQYAQESARRLIDRYDLHGRDIIEIGSGQGDFLSLLCALGNNRGVGFDPSYDPSKPATKSPSNVTIIPELFADRHADRAIDLLCALHVLEHIPAPLELLRGLRCMLADRTSCALFFEVPSASYMLRRGAIWDILYEHCSYFTARSIRNLFSRAGFRPLETRETFEGQFLTIDARPGAGGNDDDSRQQSADAAALARFRTTYWKKVAHWRDKLADFRKQGTRAVVWGAGTKGVTFLNTLGVSHDCLPHVVDLNPRKTGRFTVGTGQEIVLPQQLKEHCPDVILIMNPIYRNEIAQMCGELGIQSELLTVD